MYTRNSISRMYSIFFITVYMLALAFSALNVTTAHAAGIRYAKPTASGAGNCSSWANACILQTALTGALSGDEIWAAAGTYKPTTVTNRQATFQLKDGVTLYGGFAGTEAVRTQRDPAANLTTLSGDIGTVGDNSDNSYHVVTGATNATLDGFTITAGNAHGVSPADRGGGIYNDSSSPTLSNLTISSNSAVFGGGIYNGSSKPTLENITFSGNSADDLGGGMGNYSSNPTLTNITFTGNVAQTGGGIGNFISSSPALTNVTFSGNLAQYGGGIGNSYSSSPQIRNTILWGNTGAQIYNSSSTSTPLVSYSVVQDGCPAGSTCTGVINADPRLGTLGNYGGSTHTFPLLPGSSAINVGDNSTCPATDQRGIARPQGTVCDIGAYEYDYTGIYYVKQVASGNRNCQSWENACIMQNALATAIKDDEIWAKAGTYWPATGTDRTATFQLKNGVAIYGGFAGSETARNQRDPAVNVTILSGDIGSADDNSDNSYHVVTGATGAILDGFTITAGNANGAGSNTYGGGMYNQGSSPTLRNITFSGNSAYLGGGMYSQGSSPMLTNITFSDNSAQQGGGMYNDTSTPTLTNVTINGNSAQQGGGMRNEASSPTLTNVTFSDNSATNGGGMGNYAVSTPLIRNTILWGNTATGSGAQIYNSSSTPVVSYSVVQGGYSGGTYIIAADPKLGMLGNHGGSTQTIPLLGGSSAINAGDDSTCAATDQRGIPRPQGTHCDIGAYEYVPIYYVKSSASGTGNCQSWENACLLQEALTIAVSGDEIWVAAGTYKPTPDTNRLATFLLKNGVFLYGGFAGTETARSQRDPASNLTTLSGDIGIVNDNSDNSYHVVTGATGATLDGFTITAGNANATSDPIDFCNPNGCGGGMYNYFSSPIIANVTFNFNMANYGGGMLNYFSSPELMNVTFSGNTAHIWGGGMGSYSSDPALTNVTISGNKAESGGGLANIGSLGGSPTFTNVTISGNEAASFAGGMYNQNNIPLISNTILWGNTAEFGAQILNNESSPVVSYTVIQDGYTGGTQIITDDPRLGTLGNYGGSMQTIPLLIGSSAIDTGNNSVCPPTDQRGIPRPQGAQCDIGAFEQDDFTAPIVIAFTAPNSSNSHTLPIPVFSATDNKAVTGYLITQSSTPPAAGASGWAGTAPATYTVASDGSYTLYPWAKDAAGNVSREFAFPRTVVVDTTAPETMIINKPADPDNDSTPTFAFSGNDGMGSGVSSFMCKLDGGSYTTCTSPFTLSNLANGLHTFYVYAIDMLGNADASPASYTWMKALIIFLPMIFH